MKRRTVYVVQGKMGSVYRLTTSKLEAVRTMLTICAGSMCAEHTLVNMGRELLHNGYWQCSCSGSIAGHPLHEQEER